jgi:tight adherence protein B
LSLLAAPLRAGATPALALATVARAMSPGPELLPVLVDLVASEPAGPGLSAVWQRHAERLDSEDLRFVGRAWELTERTGAPLAEALVSVERVLRTRQRARERVATAAAGPRSSMAVLVALPCAGPLVGLTFGIGPVALYGSSAAACASAALGVVLGLVAWVWARRIISGALRTGSAATSGAATGRIGAR